LVVEGTTPESVGEREACRLAHVGPDQLRSTVEHVARDDGQQPAFRLLLPDHRRERCVAALRVNTKCYL
jgi:hypothetical protein